MHRLIHAFAVVTAVSAVIATANAQMPRGNVATGQRLATAYCSQCHVIAPSGVGGWTNAPSFPSIAARPTTTARWLEDVIQKVNTDMLHTPRSPSEAADLAAYILSLKQQ
jgi:mono/diheme cytochrome c family protein